ncbi:MAG: hypothetical protein ACQEP1_00660 [Nanobdellota archaeon]
MEWHRNLGYKRNPFWIDPFSNPFSLVDRSDEAEELLYAVSSGSMCILEGGRGTGKTALLRYVKDHFKGRVVYIDGSRINKRFDINKVLPRKRMIVLIDDMKRLSAKNNERIKLAYDEDRISSVVFTTDDLLNAPVSKSIMERVGNNIVRLSNYYYDTMLEILETRRSRILPPEMAEFIYWKTGNMKDLLLWADKSAENAVKKGKTRISDSDIVCPDIHDKDETVFCEDCGAELREINSSWRCEYCDVFCRNCGHLIENGDMTCPECGEEIEDENVV